MLRRLEQYTSSARSQSTTVRHPPSREARLCRRNTAATNAAGAQDAQKLNAHYFVVYCG